MKEAQLYYKKKPKQYQNEHTHYLSTNHIGEGADVKLAQPHIPSHKLDTEDILQQVQNHFLS